MIDFSPIDQMLAAEIEAQHFPGVVYLVSENGETKCVKASGNAVVIPEIIPATTDTIYDLASLTKPLVTTLLCAMLQEQQRLKFDLTVGSYLPDFNANDKCDITVKQLLTHSSGLPAWRPLYAEISNPSDVLRHISQIPLANPVGTKVVYSDLGFIVPTGFASGICEICRRTSLGLLIS